MPKVRAVSPSAHHLVKFIHQEAQVQDRSFSDVARGAGLNPSSLQHIFYRYPSGQKRRRGVTIDSIEACLNALGYTTKITPLKAKNDA